MTTTTTTTTTRHNNTVGRRTTTKTKAVVRLAVLLLLLSVRNVVQSYPVLVHVDEKSERCFRFNIPEDDDAHLIGLVLPNEDELNSDDAIENWYNEQVYALTKSKSDHNNVLPKKLLEDPTDDVATKMSNYLKQSGGQNTSGLRIQITGTPTTDAGNYQHSYSTKYFTPVVVNYVGRTTDARLKRNRNKRDNRAANLEGYGICFTNTDKEKQVQVIFDVVLVSEEIYDDDIDGKNADGRFDKEQHLTPLETSLDASISAANSVLREMKYMERRESRMRKTAESINSRVRWFSYLSVSVLLSVTYIQVTYLKRYFHKKKLM